MKKRLSTLILLFVCLVSCFVTYKLTKKIYNIKICGAETRSSQLANKYLCGLNGIEIGGAKHNSFKLNDIKNCDKIGAYTNIDFNIEQSDKWGPCHTDVNLIANGDDLPFKNNTLDYVVSSHMIEHSFDPIKTVNEWLRVIKPGGYIFMIIPHKERTLDINRNITTVDELIKRHNGTLNITNYGIKDVKMIDNKKVGKALESEIQFILNKKNIENLSIIKEDDHHHWSVWDTKAFLDLAKTNKWNVVDYRDVDDKAGNGFTIVIKK